MLPCDSGADESNSCNSNANFPPIQIMQLCLTSIWHCSVNYLVNNKSRDQFRFLIGEVSISVFWFWRNIDTTTGNTALLKNYHSQDHCLLSKWKHVTCAETPLHASTQKRQKLCRKRIRKSHGCNNNNVRLLQLQSDSERYNRRNGKWVPYSQWYLFRQTCKRWSQIPLNLTLPIALTLLTLILGTVVNKAPTCKR